MGKINDLYLPNAFHTCIGKLVSANFQHCLMFSNMIILRQILYKEIIMSLFLFLLVHPASYSQAQ